MRYVGKLHIEMPIYNVVQIKQYVWKETLVIRCKTHRFITLLIYGVQLNIMWLQSISHVKLCRRKASKQSLRDDRTTAIKEFQSVFGYGRS